MVYLIGSLKNPKIPDIANQLTAAGYEAFADWHGAGPDADDKLWEYAQLRGLDYRQALQTYAAKNIFDFDKKHIDRAEMGVLIAPFGRSGCLELGYMLGDKKPGFVLLDKDPSRRLEVMLQFATGIAFNMEELLTMMRREEMKRNRSVELCVSCGREV